jgi:hypothetical protein
LISFHDTQHSQPFFTGLNKYGALVQTDFFFLLPIGIIIRCCAMGKVKKAELDPRTNEIIHKVEYGSWAICGSNALIAVGAVRLIFGIVLLTYGCDGVDQCNDEVAAAPIQPLYGFFALLLGFIYMRIGTDTKRLLKAQAQTGPIVSAEYGMVPTAEVKLGAGNMV